MTPNELRALADALHWVQYTADWQACDQAADYLRAQADAQPVAWIAHNLTTGRVKWTTDRCRARGWRQDADLRVKLLYADPAPAAPQAEPADRCRSSETPDPKATGRSSPERPASNREDAAATVAAGSGEQAEPCIGNDPTCPCQDGDACHYRDAADGTKGWPVPQAEPKREPPSDEWIDTALQTDPVLITRLMIGSMTVGEFRAALRRLARIVERAHGIGGSDAE